MQRWFILASGKSCIFKFENILGSAEYDKASHSTPLSFTLRHDGQKDTVHE